MAENFGNKLLGSIGSLLIGILVFLGSFVILYFTEVRTDYSVVADKAVEIEQSSEDVDFIYYSGEFTTSEKLSDGLYLKEGDYIAINRKVEMFSWVEEVETDDNDVKHYSYKNEWIDEPADSNEFDEPSGHNNPQKTIQNERFEVVNARIGEYEVDMDTLRLPGLKALKLTADNINTDEISGDVDELFDDFEYYDDEGYYDEADYYEDEETVDGWTITEYEDEDEKTVVDEEDKDKETEVKSREYIFIGVGSLQKPEVGDMRLSYNVYRPGEKVTVFGKVDANQIAPHHGENESKIYRAFSGDHENAKSQLKKEYKTAGWMGRIGGFIAMWIGLTMILKPLTVSMELIPIIGSIGKSALGIVTFVVALVLTIITSLILSILHSIWGIAIIAVVVVGFGFYLNNKPPKAAKPGKS